MAKTARILRAKRALPTGARALTGTRATRAAMAALVALVPVSALAPVGSALFALSILAVFAIDYGRAFAPRRLPAEILAFEVGGRRPVDLEGEDLRGKPARGE